MTLLYLIISLVAMCLIACWHRIDTTPPNQFHADWPKPWHTPAW